MNKYSLSGFAVAVVLAVMSSCQSGPKEEQSTTAMPKDSTAAQTLQPKDTGFAAVNGLNLYYEVYGEGKPIVLLHGSFMNIPLNWAQIIPLLAKDRKVIVAEMQAHGRTKDIAREFSYEYMADDVSGLLKHLKIDSADILGYSMGGGVAFQMAVRHPEQVRRLVVLSGTYTHDGWWPEVEAMYSTMNAEMFKGSPIEQQFLDQGNDSTQFPAYLKKVLSIDLKPYDWSKEVKSLKMPVFMAIGDADGVRYEHALELFRAKGGGKMGDMHGMPHSRLAILPGTTHIGMMHKANLWVPMVTDFLDGDLNAPPPSF
ncbi:alpha/beta fold hydrolase [Chitinophaga deserti]|uniref:alpha/beta fold hydrolase n=1 Tax=Chitinophaga deserti TaxID=2164099 RepID=UPI000D6C4D0F|nr:alpha/beta hydrolase [Chitinophaga deserti]